MANGEKEENLMFTKRKSTDALVVHCSATSPKMDVGAADIERWHRQRGFLAIGYHFVIRRNGKIEKGRAEDVIGAHVENHNATTIGICMVGGIDSTGAPENNFTPAQFETLHSLLKDLQTRYPNTTVLGHRDFPKVAKACPSFDVRSWLKTNPL